MTPEWRKLDPGRGYVRGGYLKQAAAERAAFELAQRFYGDRIAGVVARALHVAPSGSLNRGEGMHVAGIFGLLHRLVEETDATVADVRDAGLPEDAAALLDAISARDGETPKQTALRAVTDPYAVGLIVNYTSGSDLFRAPQQAGSWWPTDPDAWAVLDAEIDRRKELAEQARLTERYHHSLPMSELEKAGIPVEWANALKDSFKRFTDPDRDILGGRYAYNRNRHYDRRRVARLDEGQHLIDCYRAGITPEQYAAYVNDTELTWKQIPAWHEAGLAPELAAEIDTSYGRNAKAVKAAAELTGDPARLRALYKWACEIGDSERHRTGRCVTRWTGTSTNGATGRWTPSRARRPRGRTWSIWPAARSERAGCWICAGSCRSRPSRARAATPTASTRTPTAGMSG